MPSLKITAFLGEVPRTGERLLPDTASTNAENVNLTSGYIRPVRQAETTYAPVVSGPILAAFRAVWGTNEKWRAWTKDIDIAKAPFSVDVEPRYYWTGDVCPRYATFTQFGTTEYALGVPAPVAAPTVTSTGGTGSTVTRIYCYTFYNPTTGEESAPSGFSTAYSGKVDGTWSVSSFEASFINSFTGTAAVTGLSVSITNGTQPTYLNVGDSLTISGYTYTVLTTPTTTSFTVAMPSSPPTGYTAITNGACTWTRVVPYNTSGLYQRLYRTAGTTAQFQLVAQRAGSTSTWTDTLTDAQIMGDALISVGWDVPPPGLTGIFALPNGSLCGFVNNLVCYSEPYQPHAWPVIYQTGTDYPIVGIASYGTTVVAATSAYPYILDGVDPASVTSQRVDNAWPCLNKRSVCSVGDGVVYATTYGLAYLGMTGPDIFTKDLFTREDWEPLNPASMIVAMAEGKVFIAHTPALSQTKLLVINPVEAAKLTRYSYTPTEMYTDPNNGKLYLLNTKVEKWDAAAGSTMLFNWKSKEIELLEPCNLGAAKIEFENTIGVADGVALYNQYYTMVTSNQTTISTAYKQLNCYNSANSVYNKVAVNGSSLTRVPEYFYLDFSLLSNGVEVFAKRLLTNDAFNLPGGYKSDLYQVSLSGKAVKVKSVKLAESKIGLKLV